MKERPINCKSHEVRAILEGRKTQTRLVVRPQPASKTVSYGCIGGQGFGFIFGDVGHVVKCPYGEPGDRLWTRETWSSDFKAHYPCEPVWYAADDDRKNDMETRDGVRGIYSPESREFVPFRWRPSIYMRRELSRIMLEIVGVRVERLQEIGGEDAIAEGIEGMHGMWASYSRKLDRCVSPILSYRTLWDSINDKPGKAWEDNPWVWVVEFKRM